MGVCLNGLLSFPYKIHEEEIYSKLIGKSIPMLRDQALRESLRR